MRIAFMGAHGVGKTSLATKVHKDLKNIPNLPPHTLIVDTTRAAFEAFEDAFEEKVDETTINAYRLTKWIEAGNNFVCDRTLVEPCVYASIYKSISDQALYLMSTTARYFLLYGLDIVFYLPIAIDLVDDGTRPMDPKLQGEVDEGIRSWMSEANSRNMIKITSSTIEERASEAMGYIIKRQQEIK